jgi:hypothetical protein
MAVVNQDWRIVPDNTSTFEIWADGGQLPDNEGQAMGGGANTITLNVHAVDVDSTYVGNIVALVSGTGKGQIRVITAYNGTTHVATVHDAWVTQPVLGTGYYIVQSGRSQDINLVDLAQASVLAAVAQASTVAGVAQASTVNGVAQASVIAALENLSTADILAAAYEGTESVQDYLRLTRAIQLGKTTGGGTASVTFFNASGTTMRVTAQVDANNNRATATTSVA